MKQKVKLFPRELELFGFAIKEDHHEPLEERVEALRRMKRPGDQDLTSKEYRVGPLPWSVPSTEGRVYRLY